MAKKKSGDTAASTSKVQSVARVVPHHSDRDTAHSSEREYQQWLSSFLKQLEDIQPGRILRVDLSTSASPGVCIGRSQSGLPRYTVTLVDHSLAQSTSPSSSELSCGVLILSQGREYEWLFSHSEGQQSLCRQHSFHRLLLVALNRGHSFASLQSVQCEIRECVASLLPAKERRGAVPFLALSADIGVRREVAVLPTDANGEVVVEDVREAEGQWIRRLLFVSIGMVQSEARLLTTRGSKSNTPPPVNSPIDFAYLPRGYHRSFLAALSLLPSPPSSILLIGVGAGSLAMFLSCVLPLCSLTLIELDGAILRAAEAYFGFHPSARMTVRIMDGVEYLTSTAADQTGLYDVVCVDCNSGDLSEGLTFPPPAFLSPAALSATHTLCRPSSLFLLNFGCRSAAKRESVVLDLLDRWDELYEVDVDEAGLTNTVLAARRTDNSMATTAAAITTTDCLSRIISGQRVAEWRQRARESGDQLQPFEWDEQMDLTDTGSRVQQISRLRAAQHALQEHRESGETETQCAADRGAGRWVAVMKPLPSGCDDTGPEAESEAGAGAEEKADGAEQSAAERKRAKARAKRARQKAKGR